MTKMQIKLDEDKINLENKHTISDIWEIVNKEFAKFNCDKETQRDGSVIFYENLNSKDGYVDFIYVMYELASNATFVTNCTKWLWFDDDNEEDVLANVADLKYYKLKHRL